MRKFCYGSGNRLINYFAGLLLLFLINSALAQEASESSKIKLNMNSSILQLDNFYMLKASVKARFEGQRRMQPVKNIPVQFYLVTESKDSLIGTAVADEKGEAIFALTKSIQYYQNKNGQMTFLSKFMEDGRFLSTSAEATIKLADMQIRFELIDSVKSIVVTASGKNNKNELLPLEGLKIFFYVPRTFSFLKLGETVLYGGSCSINFPVTLPGDSLGNLKIIARIEDSDDYGSVEVSGIKNWGEPRNEAVIENRRGLGDTDAPLWMVYTLIVLLSAVWIHYLYVFYVIYLIKKNKANVR